MGIALVTIVNAALERLLVCMRRKCLSQGRCSVRIILYQTGNETPNDNDYDHDDDDEDLELKDIC